jgi:hypothetical protein
MFEQFLVEMKNNYIERNMAIRKDMEKELRSS